MINDDPVSSITAKVRNEVDRVEARSELERNRRVSDHVDSWLKVFVPIFLSAAIISLFSMNSIQNKHDIIIAQLQESFAKTVARVDELQTACHDMVTKQNLESEIGRRSNAVYEGEGKAHENRSRSTTRK